MICENNILHIVKGDDLKFAIVIYQPDGVEYVMQDGDTLYFTVVEAENGTKVIENSFNNNIIQVSRAVTATLDKERYLYDVKLKMTNESGYLIYTVIPLSNLVVHPTSKTIS